MARKSRRITENNASTELVHSGDKRYPVAIYVRLSAEDERKVESESVENQIKFLRAYVEGKEDLIEADLYVDRGITGTKFDRPEFNRMMEDMKAGKFSCIVVKDLSRFGRNYLETGNYLESIFPIFGIRFISVTDNYDSLTSKATEDGLIVPLKNLINEAYAKDISKKACASKQIRQKKGEFAGSRAPYGYILDPKRSGHLIVDEEVRPVIVRIFEERAAGKSIEKITAGLNRDGISCPSRYRYEKGNLKCERYKDSLWYSSVVRNMLKSRVYNGDLEQGRTKQALYKNQPTTKIPREDWIITENAHEPVVSKELFAKVQEIFKKTGKEVAERNAKIVPAEKPENYVKGIFFCGDCGAKLSYRVFHRKSGNTDYGYVCVNARQFVGRCSHKQILKGNLDAMLEKVLTDHIRLYEISMNEMKSLNTSDASGVKRKDFAVEIAGMREELSKLEEKNSRLYGDFADGIMSEKDYLFARDTYRNREGELKIAIEAKSAEAKHYAADYKGDESMAEAFDAVKGLKILSSEAVHALVERICLYCKGRIEIRLRFQDELDAFVKETMERRGDA